MGVQRINTRGKQVTVTMDGRAIAATEVEVRGRAEAAIRTLLETRLGQNWSQTSTLHKNRDGSIALAIGEAPGVWPEDES